MVQYILADSSHVGVLHGIRGSYGSPMEYHTVIIIIVSSLITNPCMENLSRFWSLGFNSCSWQKTQTWVTRPMSVDLTVSVYLRLGEFLWNPVLFWNSAGTHDLIWSYQKQKFRLDLVADISQRFRCKADIVSYCLWMKTMRVLFSLQIAASSAVQIKVFIDQRIYQFNCFDPKRCQGAVQMESV